ncbi:MAG TPA: tetratricopeptide repeat protein [Terriglobales bacterium]|nr:tetratricopeptide repeat protein [Terriglobales bacterium]
MPGYTRHQLKQDKFAEAAAETLHWTVVHRKTIVTASGIAGVVLAAVLGGWLYLRHQDGKASEELGAAVRTLTAPLGAPDPNAPGIQTFPTAKERAQAAQKKFREIAEKYRFTKTAEIAHYLAGVTAGELGDVATAEQELAKVAGSRNKDLAPLAKLAMAAMYHGQGRDADAIKIYKELIDHPTPAVPKTLVQLELAALYEESQPAEAVRLYQQIKIEDPNGPAGQIASSRLELVMQP